MPQKKAKLQTGRTIILDTKLGEIAANMAATPQITLTIDDIDTYMYLQLSGVAFLWRSGTLRKPLRRRWNESPSPRTTPTRPRTMRSTQADECI